MDKLKLECLKPEYSIQTYERFIKKPNLKKNEKGDLLFYHLSSTQMIEDLFAGKYIWSVPKKVLISKTGTTKKRVVYIYNLQDRYLLGILYRAFSNYFKDKISSHCYSYKTGISTNTAVQYICDNIDKFRVGVKVDIHAYFNSVSEERVNAILEELFKGNLLDELKSLMFDKRVLYKGYEIEEFKSLIPGCALGSFFANYCLKPLDDELEKQNVIFARYSDDIIVLSENQECLSKTLDTIKYYLNSYGLELNEDKYKWFDNKDTFDFLGLQIAQNKNIDISKHSKQKMKRQIKKWCDKGRKEIELYGMPFDKVAQKILKRWNNKNFKCYIRNESTFGWCHYAFRYITTDESLKEIDLYVKDTLRAMKTGKHNKANYKALSEEEFQKIGWVSLVQLYHLYRKDFDYYCEVIELL